MVRVLTENAIFDTKYDFRSKSIQNIFFETILEIHVVLQVTSKKSIFCEQKRNKKQAKKTNKQLQ